MQTQSAAVAYPPQAIGRPKCEDYPISKRYSWFVFTLLFILMLYDFIDRQVITALFPYFKEEWGITDAQCGLLVSVVNWALACFAIPVGILADRWSRKKTIGLMSTIWGIACFSCAFIGNFAQLLSLRFILGLGEAGYGGAGTALLWAHFPQRLRSTLTGIFMGGAPLGSAIGVALGGYIAVHFGWRHAFGVVAIPGIIFALIFFTVRDYKTVALTTSDKGCQPEHLGSCGDGSRQAAPQRAMSKKEILKMLLHTPSVFATYCAAMASTFFLGVIFTWPTTYFLRVHQLPLEQASRLTGILLLMSVIGSFLGGYLADKFVSRGRVNARPLAAAFMQLLTAAFFITGFSLEVGNLKVVFLMLGGMMVSAYMGPMYSSFADLVHPGMRTSSVSSCIFMQNIGGFAWGPLVAGILSDIYGIQTSMLVCSIAPIVAIICFMVAAKFYARDAANVEKVDLQME